MIAAISLDLSMVLELLSPLVPGYFLLIASVANVGGYVDHSKPLDVISRLARAFSLNARCIH